MKKQILFLLFPIVLLSCKSVPTDIVYFQDIDQYKEQLMKYVPENREFIIKEGDLLVITVSSPDANQELVAQFNLPMFSYLQAGQTLVSQSGLLQTYTVNEKGNISFPVLGETHLAGMVKSEAIQLLSQKISNYIIDPVVNVQISSYGVIVLGEVNSPGYVGARNEKMTILDAIGGANDLTIYGDRKNIRLIREVNGAKEIAKIDLTKSDVFFSSYYYLQQGDVIIVEPNNTRKKASEFGSAENYTLSIISLSFGAISTLVTILLLFEK